MPTTSARACPRRLRTGAPGHTSRHVTVCDGSVAACDLHATLEDEALEVWGRLAECEERFVSYFLDAL